jgi:hypothetical protein
MNNRSQVAENRSLGVADCQNLISKDRSRDSSLPFCSEKSDFI